jgi:hypothetical protein
VGRKPLVRRQFAENGNLLARGGPAGSAFAAATGLAFAGFFFALGQLERRCD